MIAQLPNTDLPPAGLDAGQNDSVHVARVLQTLQQLTTTVQTAG